MMKKPVTMKAPAEQVGVGFVAFLGLADVGLLIDRHQAQKAHQPPDPLLIHGMAFVLQVPGHLPDNVKRGLKKLLVDEGTEMT